MSNARLRGADVPISIPDTEGNHHAERSAVRDKNQIQIQSRSVRRQLRYKDVIGGCKDAEPDQDDNARSGSPGGCPTRRTALGKQWR